MSEKQQQSRQTASGVEALIERLKNEGVNAGQTRAEDIVLNAQKRAEWIVQEAEQEADHLISEARQQADDMLASAQDALQLAARDAFINLRDKLLNSFSEEVARVVGQKMQDRQFLEQLILALAAQVRESADMDQSAEMTLLLPETVIGTDELKKHPEDLKQGALSLFTAEVAGQMLRKGVRFEVADDLSGGLFIKLQEDGMEIDFSDETVAALLLEHIQPRFRSILQGMVK